MALKLIYSTQDEIPEAVRGAYVERDGKFHLDLEGAPDDKLKGALDKERKAREQAEKALKDLKSALGDKDPAAAKAALEKLAELEEKGLLSEGKFDEAVKARVERMVADHKAQMDKLTGENQGLTGQLEELLIDNAIRAAASKARVRDTAVEDAVLLAKTVFKLKDGQPVPMKGNEILFGKDPTKPQTMDEWMSERAKDRGHWFEGSGGGGATGSGSTGAAGSGKQVSISREEAKDPATYRMRREEAAKAGKELVIAQ